MENITLNFTASGQRLSGQVPINLSSNTVAYILAVFDLGDGWDTAEYDAIVAVWRNDFARVATILDQQNRVTVPWEVLNRRSTVCVNLVAYKSINDALVERMTSYPARAIVVDAESLVYGTETPDPTPSLFEQFIAEVHTYADGTYADSLKAEGYAVGEQDGEPVESGTYYHNNAKYYSEQAGASAISAGNSATLAGDSASTAVTKAEEAAASALDAFGAAESATNSKNKAAQSATAATNKASEASGYATTARNKADEASAYATNASNKADEAAASAAIAQNLSQTLYMKSDGLLYITIDEDILV